MHAGDPAPRLHARPRVCILRRQSGGFGGAELMARRYADFLRPGWDTEVYSEPPGRRLVRAPWWRAWRYARAADRAMRERRPDIVFSLERGPRCDVYQALEGVHERWLELRPGFGTLQRLANPWHWACPRLETRTLASARAVVANSRMVQADLARFHPACAERVRVIHNGVDGARFRPADEPPAAVRRRLHLPDTGPLLLFVGSGWERKGLARALGILARLRASRPDAHLAVLGKGRPSAYAGLAARLDLARAVTWAGTTGDTAPWYQAADAFILPALYDPCANACIEALRCGCPVVTTPTNGAHELVEHGTTGFVLGDDDDEAAAFLAAPHPPRAEVAATAAHLTAERECAAYDALFRDLLERAATSRS